MVAFYNVKDRTIYDAGDKFMSQSKYLQNDYVPTEGISYEGDGSPVSYANSMGGIMSQAPVATAPLPLVVAEGDDGDNNNTGPPGSYDSQFDPVTEKEAFNKDIGVGTIAEEDDEEEGKIGKMSLAKIAGSTLFGGLFAGTYTGYKEKEKAKQKEIDKINAAIDAQYGPSDPGLRGNDDTPGFGITATGNYTNQFEGGDPGLGGGTKGGFDTGGGKEMMARGGRAGYFFGGRVDYKAGGRIGFAGGGKDAGKDSDFGNEDYGGDKDDNREQYGAVGQYKTGPTSTKTNDDGNQSFFKDPKTLYDYTNFGFNIPTGLTTTTPYGKLSAIMNLNKTFEEEDLEGRVQFDTSIGPVNTTTAFDTDIGPTFNASYNQGPVNIGYNNLNGINASYNNGPVSVGYNNGQATLGYSKSFAKGGRVSFKNGGLASIL